MGEHFTNGHFKDLAISYLRTVIECTFPDATLIRIWDEGQLRTCRSLTHTKCIFVLKSQTEREEAKWGTCQGRQYSLYIIYYRPEELNQ